MCRQTGGFLHNKEGKSPGHQREQAVLRGIGDEERKEEWKEGGKHTKNKICLPMILFTTRKSRRVFQQMTDLIFDPPFPCPSLWAYTESFFPLLLFCFQLLGYSFVHTEQMKNYLLHPDDCFSEVPKSILICYGSIAGGTFFLKQWAVSRPLLCFGRFIILHAICTQFPSCL